MQILKYVRDKSSWTQLLSACVGAAMVQQHKLYDIIGDSDWNIDFEAGKISFAELVFGFQFIGSEANKQGTWLWGWENVNGFDDRVLNLANATRKIGEQLGAEPLTTAKFALEDGKNGHAMSIVACVLGGQVLGYYACAYEGGCAYVAITDEAGANAESAKANLASEKLLVHEFAKIAQQCIQAFELDHKIFIQSFLDYVGVPFEVGEQKGGWFKKATSEITAKFSDDLVITFDDKDRITNFKYSVKSPEELGKEG